MRKTTEGRRTGIRRNFTSILEDLEFANDIALLHPNMSAFKRKKNS